MRNYVIIFHLALYAAASLYLRFQAKLTPLTRRFGDPEHVVKPSSFVHGQTTYQGDRIRNLVSHNNMNNFYQQHASYNAPPSPSYHQNVQNYNTVQSGPDMNYRQSGRDRHFPLRSSLQRSDASRNHWEEQANLNTTHAAEALRHLGGLSTGRPDTTGPNFSGYGSINDGSLNNRQSDNRDHSQSGTVAYSYFQAEHPQNDLSSANRQSDNHFTSIVPGRDVIKQGQQDPQHRAFATSNLANISSIDHRSGFPAQNGPNLIGLGRRLQPDNASQSIRYAKQTSQQRASYCECCE